VAWTTDLDVGGKWLKFCVEGDAVPSNEDVLEYVDPTSGETTRIKTGIVAWSGGSRHVCPDGAIVARVVGRSNQP